MGSKVEYLYGDSSPAPVNCDFIAFLRDAVDFSVEVMRREGWVGEAAQRTQRMAEEMEREIEKTEALSAQMSLVLDAFTTGESGPLATRCAARVRQGVADVVHSEAEHARSVVTAERARVTKSAAAAREAIVGALETLLVRRELPDAAITAKLSLQQGTHYDVQFHGQTPYGLKWAVTAEIPPSDPLSHVLRVERVVERLEIEVKESVGWIHREVKPRAQRLDRLYLTELESGPAACTLKLRSAPEDAARGFNILFSPGSSRVEVLRKGEEGQGLDAPHSVEGEDAGKLQALRDALAAMVLGLSEHKGALLMASLDGTPLQRHEAPRVLVERLIASIAPTVDRISRGSLVPGELVLKKRLDDGHREEVFVSKAELRKKVESLPLSLQEVFDPLALREADLHDPEAPPAKSPSQPPGQNNFRSAPALTSTGKWPSRLPPPGIEQSPADRE